MMTEASFASLGPTLLARKGGAKPAMRPQLTPLPENLSELAAIADEQLEDLGWNDMGGEGAGSEGAGHETAANSNASDTASSAASPEQALILSKPRPAKVAAPHDEAEDYGDDYEAEYGDDYEDEDEDAESGPFEIIDPLAGAIVVPINGHAADRGAARRPAANEDTFDRVNPVVVTQQQRLAQRIGVEAATHASPDAGADPAPVAAAGKGNAPLLWQKPSRAPGASGAPVDAREQERAAPGQSSAERAADPADADAPRGGSKNTRRAAFTLRLDTERHLKLRLAATMQGVSAQALVTEALDAMLGDIEELDALIARLKRD